MGWLQVTASRSSLLYPGHLEGVSLTQDCREQQDDSLGPDSGSQGEPALLMIVNILIACLMGAIVSGMPLPVPFADVSLGRAESYVAFMAACIVLTSLYWFAGLSADGGRHAGGAGAVSIGMLAAAALYAALLCSVILTPLTALLGSAALTLVVVLVAECIRAILGRPQMLLGGGSPILAWPRAVTVGIISWLVFLPALDCVPCAVQSDPVGFSADAITSVEEGWSASDPEGRLALLRGLASSEAGGRTEVCVEAGAFGMAQRRATYIGADGTTLYVNLGYLADSKSGVLMSREVSESVRRMAGFW